MKRIVLFTFMICASTVFADSKLDYKTVLIEKNNLMESFEFQDEGTLKPEYSALSLPVCSLPSPLPVVPVPPYYQFTSKWGMDDRLDFTLWRRACDNDATKSAVLMRVVPSNQPFLCSPSLIVIQDNRQFDSVKIVDTPDGYSFCGDLYVSMTFLLEQYSHLTNFDDQGKFTLIHEGVWETNSVIIPAYSYTPNPINNDIVVNLEEPTNNSTVTGVGNLRGWAVAPGGIAKIEFYIDGKYKFNIPYGGKRDDVGKQYPSYPGSSYSGFGMAYSFSRTPDNYTYSVRAVDKQGKYKEARSNIATIRFHSPYISNPTPIDMSSGRVYGENNNIIMDDITVDGLIYDLMLKWNTPSQAFEIMEIDPQ